MISDEMFNLKHRQPNTWHPMRIFPMLLTAGLFGSTLLAQVCSCPSGSCQNQPPEAQCSGTVTDYCMWPSSGCPSPYTPSPTGCCCRYSPIIIDISGDGFTLTDAEGGVRFSTGTRKMDPVLFSWTAPHSDDAWLALDRNGNDRIDDATELFGNFTPQPPPPAGESRNGFRALAMYDELDRRGDNDGFITQADAVFSQLRLWQDSNHNGISEPEELHTLSEFRIYAISLAYHESRKTDPYGNSFRYRAAVLALPGSRVGTWAWDVFLQAAPRR